MAVALKYHCGSVTRTTKRLLGEILIDGGFIDSRDLERALEQQKRTNSQLGEILVHMGVVDPVELKAVLSIQRTLASFDDSVKVGAGVRLLLGELLLKAKRLTKEQIDRALQEQQRTGEKLGEILVRLGLLREHELNVVLEFQRYQGEGEGDSSRLRLCEILVATEQITRGQLEDVLARQKISQKKIGEILVEAGYVQPHQIDQGLKLQQKLVTAALVAALSMANVAAVREAHAVSPGGSSATSKIAITATVLERTKLQIVSQVQELVITNADITRGYVEVPAASRISVRSNNPAGYLLAFEVMGDPSSVFHSVNVVVGGRDILLSGGGGWVPQPYMRGGVTMDVSYRFTLSKSAQPGTYNWPLMISVLPK